MTIEHADGRPRVFITSNRDKRTCVWARHPSARGTFALSPGAALDAALAELGGEAAVVIFEPRPPG
jgi:hypothetical protein